MWVDLKGPSKAEWKASSMAFSTVARTVFLMVVDLESCSAFEMVELKEILMVEKVVVGMELQLAALLVALLEVY